MVHSDFVCNSEENGAGQKVLLKTAAYFQAYRLKKKQFTIECRRFSKQNGDLKAIDAGLVICEGKLKRSFSTTKKKPNPKVHRHNSQLQKIQTFVWSEQLYLYQCAWGYRWCGQILQHQ